MVEHQLAISRGIPATAQFLSPALQRVVQVLCDTYEAIDLRIETTLGAAEADFLSAMPEVANHETELRQLIRLLTFDLQTVTDANADSSQPILLRFAYQDKGDLVEQLLSGTRARIVVVPIDGEVSLHTNIQGFNK